MLQWGGHTSTSILATKLNSVSYCGGGDLEGESGAGSKV